MDSFFNGIDREKLKTFMDEKRFRHTMGVAETAVNLAKNFLVNPQQALTAALLHDCARTMSEAELITKAKKFRLPVDPLEIRVPDLLHGKVGAELAKQEFGIGDEAVLNAIRRHTLGNDIMTNLDKVIFVADMIEPHRDYPGVEHLRELAFKNLDQAFLAGLNSTILYVIERGGIIHPKSIEARNSVIISLGGPGV